MLRCLQRFGEDTQKENSSNGVLCFENSLALLVGGSEDGDLLVPALGRMGVGPLSSRWVLSRECSAAPPMSL